MGIKLYFKNIFLNCTKFQLGSIQTFKILLFFFFLKVSYLAADALFPEWKIWTQFLDQTTDGLRLDGLSESHPIEVLVLLFACLGATSC